MLDRKKKVDIALGICTIALIVLNHNTFDFSKETGCNEYFDTKLQSDLCLDPIYSFSLIPRVSFDRVTNERLFWDVIILGSAAFARYISASSKKENHS